MLYKVRNKTRVNCSPIHEAKSPVRIIERNGPRALARFMAEADAPIPCPMGQAKARAPAQARTAPAKRAGSFTAAFVILLKRGGTLVALPAGTPPACDACFRPSSRAFVAAAPRPGAVIPAGSSMPPDHGSRTIRAVIVRRYLVRIRPCRFRASSQVECGSSPAPSSPTPISSVSRDCHQTSGA